MFFGSQTGTAEDYASRLAKEGQQRFGLRTMTIDIEDCDMKLLDKFPEDCLAFFLMATYGKYLIYSLTLPSFIIIIFYHYNYRYCH